MKKQILSLLVENHPGVLSRIAGLFSRRGYNIESLSVGMTDNPGISRMTIVVTGDDAILEQIKKQLNKLIDTIKITELSIDNAVLRELVLIKVKADAHKRSEILEIVTIFRAKIVEVAPRTLTMEMTGDDKKIMGFLELLKPYGIVEFIRSGCTGMERENTAALED